MQRALILMVKTYRLWFSPWLGGGACRFTPSCSEYALQALNQHGAGRGGWLVLCRLGRCQPWCQGGHDPVPASIGSVGARVSPAPPLPKGQHE